MCSTTMPQELADGYSRFVSDRVEEQQKLYQQLGEGQSPHTLVISCADSRVDPATIFGAAPGELFVIRNVANIVPPHAAYAADPNAHLAGTAAALEFAVGHLQVSRIVVMGHAKCGGVAAALGNAQNPSAKPEPGSGRFYIDQWVGLMNEDGAAAVTENPDLDQDGLQRCLEHKNVRRSLKRLRAFPFVEQAMSDGQLTLHGAWFSIASAELFWLQDDGQFLSVEASG